MKVHDSVRTATAGMAAVLALAGTFGCELQERAPELEITELPAARAQPQPGLFGPVFAPPEETPLVVGDDFWFGPESAAYELVGEFVSAEALAATLDPSSPIGAFDGRTWILSDVLVAVDYRGGPVNATWRIAGPADVLDGYVERLREAGTARSPLRDLGVLPLEVEHCCEGP